MNWESVWNFATDFGLNPHVCRKPLLEELFRTVLSSGKKEGKPDQLSFHGLLQLLGRIACRYNATQLGLTESDLRPVEQLHKMLEIMELSGGSLKLSKRFKLKSEILMLKYSVIS